jgi:uncharacterized protein (TIGR03643 family)
MMVCFLNMAIKEEYNLDQRSVNRIIEMAWEDRTTFEAIQFQFDLVESEVIQLMREEMKRSSWRMWRKRVQGRSTKHISKRSFVRGRHKSSRQRSISQNKIAKR